MIDRKQELENQLAEARHDLETDTRIYTERIAALESELSALAPIAPWTPRVGDEVIIRGIVENISAECYYRVSFPTAYGRDWYNFMGAALRPAPCEGEALDAEEIAEYKMIRQYCIEAMGESKAWGAYTNLSLVHELALRYQSARPAPLAPDAVDAEECKYCDGEGEVFTPNGMTTMTPCQFCNGNGSVPAVDAEPVGYVNEYTDGFGHRMYKSPSMATIQARNSFGEITSYVKETAIPVFTHPAPASGKLAASDCVNYLADEFAFDLQTKPRVYTAKNGLQVIVQHKTMQTPPVAVAGQGVVDSTDVVGYLTDLAQELEHQGDLSTANQMRKERDRLIVLPSVDDLPEWMTHFHHVTVCDYSRMSVQSFGRDNNQTLLEFAAALVAASRATAKEGNNG